MLTILIDADVLRYQLSFKNTKTVKWEDEDDGAEVVTAEVTNPEKAKADLDDYIEELLEKFGTRHFLLPLSVSTNFRKSILPTYKGNRTKPKPALWNAVDGFLHELYPEKIITREYLEGDDILGLLATMPKPRLCPGKRIIVSIDKDMQTIPGRLFNPGKPDIGMDANTLAEQAGIQQGELEMGLAEIERTVINDIETSGMRGRLGLGLKHLVATGNVLMYVPDDGNAKMYPLSRYVVDRDGMGSVLEMVTLDSVAPSTMGTELKAILGLDKNKGATKDAGPEQDVELYTRIYREGELWQVYQEVNSNIVPGSQGSYPIDACPWIPLRIPEEDGEDYGAGLVYDYYGDFDALEKLSKAILKGAAAAAKVLWALDENATIRPTTITQAESGDVLRFKAEQLKSVSQEKFGDFNFVGQHIDKLITRLEMAFGVRTSIQRSGERVTAEEIRYLAQELEDTLGGIYSILAEDLLLPLVRRIMDRLTRAHRLPDLPPGLIKPRIVVGVAALGRGQDMQKLMEWAQAAQQVLTPQVFSQRVNPGELMARMGAASDLTMKGLIKTDEQLQQEQQTDTMHQAAIRAAPTIAGAAMAPPGDMSGQQ